MADDSYALGLYSLLLLSMFGCAGGEEISGAIHLNSGVFEKVLAKYKAVLVKFDGVYPYGDSHNVFKEVAEAAKIQPELMMAEVHIADYGDLDNMDLAQRYRIRKEDYPVYKMFLNGNSYDPVRFTGNEQDAEEIKTFIKQASGLWLGLPGNVEAMDKLTKQYLMVSVSDRKEELERIEEEARKVINDDNHRFVKVYVKLMWKIVDQGTDYVKIERNRVNRLMEGKLSEKKKEDMQKTLNIITAFQTMIKEAERIKDEL